jgi:hypothetical protein
MRLSARGQADYQGIMVASSSERFLPSPVWLSGPAPRDLLYPLLTQASQWTVPNREPDGNGIERVRCEYA